jgi:hypothetical protein
MPGDDRLREQERAREVGIDDLMEVLDRHLFQRPRPLAADAARHIDQHVDRAAGLRQHGLDRGLAGDVDLGGADRAAAGLGGTCKMLDFLKQPVAGGHLAAVLGERHRDGVADAARGTGHDHALALERDQHQDKGRCAVSRKVAMTIVEMTAAAIR